MLLEKGPEALSDAALLAILLRTGRQGQNAIALAREMIGEFDGLNGLRAATQEDLLCVKGIGKEKLDPITNALQKIANRGIIGDNGLNKGLAMPIQNQKKANKLPTTILNYFAAFTETKFNFRTLINYRWTNNELTHDLAIFQNFQDSLLQKIKTGDNTPLTVKNNEHILSLSGDEVLLEINEAISDRFGLDYLKTCVNQEFTKRAERNTALVATEKGLQPAKDADLSKEDVKQHNEQAFHDGCRKYNLAFRKKIELILIELQEKKISRLKQDIGVDHVPSSTFNSANYLKKHFDALQALAQDNRTEEEYLTCDLNRKARKKWMCWIGI